MVLGSVCPSPSRRIYTNSIVIVGWFGNRLYRHQILSLVLLPFPSPSMRRPVSVKPVFLFLIRRFCRLSRAATVAILPSALFGERFFARCKLGVLNSAGAAT